MLNYYRPKKNSNEKGDKAQRRLDNDQQTNFIAGQQLSKIVLSERDQLRRAKSTTKRLGFLLLINLLICGILAFLLYNFIYKIEVQIVNNDITSINTAEYQARVKEYLNQQPLERLKFNLDQTNLLKYLQAVHPEIEQASLFHAGFLATSHFSIKLRQPLAVLTLNQQNNYVDKAGALFQDNYLVEPKLQINDQSGITSDEKQTASVSVRFLEFAGNLITLFDEFDYEVIEINLPPATIRQLHIKLNNYPFLMKFTIDRSVAEQVDDVVRTIEYLKNNKINVSYLDARIKNKIFYK